ncbi:MAG: hypothetical protein A2096_03095 [Spirochaetes bacterium GWF1_41_5]|nr:MAG: hypothetical protein A2096_03095 [Spirochaetes bacterium GWF1_41_5]
MQLYSNNLLFTKRVIFARISETGVLRNGNSLIIAKENRADKYLFFNFDFLAGSMGKEYPAEEILYQVPAVDSIMPKLPEKARGSGWKERDQDSRKRNPEYRSKYHCVLKLAAAFSE